MYIAKLSLQSGQLTYSSLHKVTIFLVLYMAKAPEIYSRSKFLVYNTVSLTVVIMLYIKSLDLFILHNCNFVPFN